MVVRSIGVASSAKIFGAMYAALGLVIGAIVALISMAGPIFPSSRQAEDAPTWLGPMLGVGAIVAFPLFYGLLGFISGALMAGFYNLFSGLVGGLKIEVQPPSPPSTVVSS
jgi:hypothetical protein